MNTWWLFANYTSLAIVVALWLIWYQLKRIANVLEVMIVDVHRAVQETAEHIADQDAEYRKRVYGDDNERRRSGND